MEYFTRLNAEALDSAVCVAAESDFLKGDVSFPGDRTFQKTRWRFGFNTP